MKKQFLVLAFSVIILGCSHHSSIPVSKGSHWDTVVMTTRNGNGWYTGVARKLVVDTVQKIYLDEKRSDSVYQHFVDSAYYIPYTIRLDTVKDKNGQPLYDSSTKHIKIIPHDTTYILNAQYVSEVDKKLYKPEKH